MDNLIWNLSQTTDSEQQQFEKMLTLCKERIQATDGEEQLRYVAAGIQLRTSIAVLQRLNVLSEDVRRLRFEVETLSDEMGGPSVTS